MLSALIERLFHPRDGSRRLVEERLHCLNLLQMTDKPLDVLRYLYDRLNIIDRKAGVILRINATTLGILGVLVSLALGRDPATAQPVVPLFGTPLFGALVMVVLVGAVVSSTLCFALGRLAFDHVTQPPDFLGAADDEGGVTRRLAAGRARLIEALCAAQPSARDRRWFVRHDRGAWAAILDCVARGGSVGGHRSLYDYEDAFFRITVARQAMLVWARFFGALGWLAYILLIAQVVLQAGALRGLLAWVGGPP